MSNSSKPSNTNFDQIRGALPGGPGMGRGRGGPGGPMMHMVNAEKPKNTSKTLRRLFSYIGTSRYLLFTLIGIMILVTVLSLIAPSLQKWAIDAITLTDQKLSVNFNQLYRALIFLAGCYLTSSVLTLMQGIFSARLSQTTVHGMRADLFSKIVKLPIRYIDTHQHGDMMSRMTNDVDNISNTISQSIGSLISGLLTIIGSVAIMLYYSPMLTLISISTIGLSLLATMIMSKSMRKYFKRQQVVLGKLNGHVEEMVTGYKTVVAYGRQEHTKSAFDDLSNELKTCSIIARIIGGTMGPIMNFIGNFGFLLIAGFGGWFAINDIITIGTIQAFILYSKQFTRPINEIANLYSQILTAMAGAERVFEILDADVETVEAKTDIEVSEIKGNLCFSHVYFSYVPDEPVLKDFNLNIKQGQKIAIVGKTGSGKTTIVNLLTRFYDSDRGSITLDGIDIKELSKDKLRQSVGIVLQDTVLFSDTIAANIKYGRLNSTNEQMENASKTANADLFIEQLPEGYNTLLSESGSNLSQGQRQLLSIARAVLSDPKILILDEATSSVDTRTEMDIQEAMLALMKNRTSLIIAHRLSTIRDADCIVVIDEGKVVEAGNHEQLLTQKGCYYKLYQNQFAGIAT